MPPRAGENCAADEDPPESSQGPRFGVAAAPALLAGGLPGDAGCWCCCWAAAHGDDRAANEWRRGAEGGDTPLTEPTPAGPRGDCGGVMYPPAPAPMSSATAGCGGGVLGVLGADDPEPPPLLTPPGSDSNESRSLLLRAPPRGRLSGSGC